MQHLRLGSKQAFLLAATGDAASAAARELELATEIRVAADAPLAQ